MDATPLLETLSARVPGAAFTSVPTLDCPTVYVPRERIIDTLKVLRDDPDLSYNALVEITAADYLPRDPRFEVVYHVVRLGVEGFSRPGVTAAPARLRLKVMVPGEAPSVPSATGLYPAADWLEREVWDLFGIEFDGHPDLRRLLLMDDWEGHPLRKDYPVQVNVPYRSTEAVQLTEQEFVANVRRQQALLAQRRHS